MNKISNKISILFLLLACSKIICCSSNDTCYEYYNLSNDIKNIKLVLETYSIDFGDKDDSSFLLAGWSGTEEGHTWAIGKQSVISFNTFCPEIDKEMAIICSPFTPLPDQSIEILLNGHFIRKISFSEHTIRNYNEIKIILPSEFQRKFQNRIQFNFALSGSPKEYLGSDDPRNLAVDFRKISFQPADTDKNFSKTHTITIDGSKNIVMSLNSMMSKNIIIKPDTILELDVTGNRKEQQSSFSVVANFDGKRKNIFLWNVNQKGKKASIDLSNYTNELIELSFVYSTNSNTTNAGDDTVSFQAALKSDIGTKDKIGPNILFLVVDTLRADHLGCYDGACETPNINQLAEEGVLFAKAYSHIPITLPEHTSLFQSKYPHQTHVLNNQQKILSNDINIPLTMKALDYLTVGIVSLSSLDKYTRFDIDFDTYTDCTDLFASMKTGDEVTLELINAVKHLSRNKNWFLFLHYSDPHNPYHAHGSQHTPVLITSDRKMIAKFDIASKSTIKRDLSLHPGANIFTITAPRQFLIRRLWLNPKDSLTWRVISGLTKHPSGIWCCSEKAVIEIFNTTSTSIKSKVSFMILERLALDEIKNRYKKEVEFVDVQIGKTLNFLRENGFLKNTIIIFTSDHGEGIGDHNLVGHTHQLYNSLLHIPLIVVYPKYLPRGKTINNRVRHIDVFPTILDILDVSIGSNLQGYSLLPLITGEEKSDRPVLSMTFKDQAKNNLVSLIDNNYKIIRSIDTNEYELYDIEKDPNELIDISKSNKRTLNSMKKKLEKILIEEEFKSAFDISKTIPLNTDKKHVDKLRGLGYAK